MVCIVSTECSRAANVGMLGMGRPVADRSKAPHLGTTQQRPSFAQLEVAAAVLAAPLRIDVRPPPLHPKRSAPLRVLGATNSSLFAGAPPAVLPVTWLHSDRDTLMSIALNFTSLWPWQCSGRCR